jgi:DNA-binding MarR family transcriptional regulator
VNEHEVHERAVLRKEAIVKYLRRHPSASLSSIAKGAKANVGDVQMSLVELEAAGQIRKGTCPGCGRDRWEVVKHD